MTITMLIETLQKFEKGYPPGTEVMIESSDGEYLPRRIIQVKITHAFDKNVKLGPIVVLKA